MKYTLAAYTTSPSHSAWQPELEKEYFAGLKELSGVGVIELPYAGSLHAHDDQWLLENLDSRWDFIFTCMPGVMKQISINPDFGIASDVESGRQAALAFYQGARQAILKLNEHLGRQAVQYIQLHTAPSRASAQSSSANALKLSLETMRSWDWDGAQLVVEHCDAYVEGRTAEKGFLTLDEEILAITSINARLGSSIGVSINWGRSAIEARSVEGPLRHIEKAQKAGVLTGVMFSGVTNKETAYGVWKDSHMPFAQAFDVSNYAEGSLLTEQQVRNSLLLSDLDNLKFLGVKIQVLPNDIDAEQRVAFNRDALSILDQCITSFPEKNLQAQIA